MKKMMKKMFATVAVIAVLTVGVTTSFADYDPNRPIDPSQSIMATKSAEGSDGITVNGKQLEGAATYTSESGEVMIPIRAVAEELEFEVGWDSGVITLTKLPVYITFAIGEDGYTFAKTAPMPLGQAPELTEEKTYVPASFFAEILNAKVNINLGGTVISYGEEEAEIEENGEEKSVIGTAIVQSVVVDEDGKTAAILVEDESLGEVSLRIGEETVIMLGDEKITFADLEENMKLSVEYGESMTMSLPPQNNPLKITVLEEK